MLKLATLRAPSAGNMAFYSIVEITDPKLKEELSILCDNQKMIAKAPLVWVFVADHQKWQDYFILDECERKSGIPLRESGWGELQLATQDALIAAQTAVIAAESMNIGSCYVGDVIENGERIAELLELPRYTMPATMLIFGYKKPVKVKKLTPRCPPEAIFMENSYRQRTKEELEKAYEEHATKEKSAAQRYYERKYTSDFQKEMNRSAKFWFNRWKG